MILQLVNETGHQKYFKNELYTTHTLNVSTISQEVGKEKKN